jgi:hypothetical protein
MRPEKPGPAHNMDNRYCRALGIEAPALEELVSHPEANSFSLLLVALLERGAPMTLPEVAERFERAGVAPAARALASLQRCRPARPPVYRSGDLYALDPYDKETELWAFRLGLRPPLWATAEAAPPVAPSQEAPAARDPEAPLTVEELRKAWREASLFGSWSAQRTALAVLDAHRRPMAPEEVLEFLEGCAARHWVSASSAQYWRRGAPIEVDNQGRWMITPGGQAEAPLRAARAAVRDLLERVRQRQAQGLDPALFEARQRELERQREAHAAELARLSRVVVHAFPAGKPQAVVLVDVEARKISTFLEPERDAALEQLSRFEVIAAVEVRGLLHALGFDPGERRLAELGPPQKTMRLNRRGRTLKITTEMLIRGSCGISAPLGEAARLNAYLEAGQITRLRRRLEADAKSLFAYYQYGRLHGAVRLRWGFLDEMLPAPWVHGDEIGLYHLKRQAHAQGRTLEVVTGSAPGWADPWARAQPCWVEKDWRGWGLELVDAEGIPIDDADVQLARVVAGPGLRIVK